MRVSYPILGVATLDNWLFLSGGGGSAKTGIKNTVDVYRIDTREDEKLFHKTMCLDTGTQLVTGLSISPDGTLMALSVAMSCWIFEIDRTEKTLQTVVKIRTDFSPQSDTEQSCVAFAGNATLLTGGQDGVVRIWKLFRDSDTGLPNSSALQCPLGADVKDASRMTLPSIGNQYTHETNSIMLMHEYRGHTQRIRQIAVEPFTRNLIATSAEDQSCHLWRLADIQRVHKFQPPPRLEIAPRAQFRCLLFADHGQTLYTVMSPSRGTSHVLKWKPQDPIQIRDDVWPWHCTASLPISEASPVVTIAVSGSHRLLAVGSAAGEVSVLRCDTMEVHKRCVGHDFAVTGLAFVAKTEAEYVLISAGADSAVMGHRVPLLVPSALTLIDLLTNGLCFVLATIFGASFAVSLVLVLLGLVKLNGVHPWSGFLDVQRGVYDSTEALVAMGGCTLALIIGLVFLFVNYRQKAQGLGA